MHHPQGTRQCERHETKTVRQSVGVGCEGSGHTSLAQRESPGQVSPLSLSEGRFEAREVEAISITASPNRPSARPTLGEDGDTCEKE